MKRVLLQSDGLFTNIQDVGEKEFRLPLGWRWADAPDDIWYDWTYDWETRTFTPPPPIEIDPAEEEATDRAVAVRAIIDALLDDARYRDLPDVAAYRAKWRPSAGTVRPANP